MSVTNLFEENKFKTTDEIIDFVDDINTRDIKFKTEYEIETFISKLYSDYRKMYREIPLVERPMHLSYGSFMASYLMPLKEDLRKVFAQAPDKSLNTTLTTLVDRIITMRNNRGSDTEIQESIYSTFNLESLRNVRDILDDLLVYLNLKNIITGIIKIAIYETEMEYRMDTKPSVAFHHGFKVISRIKNELIIDYKYYAEYIDVYVENVKKFIDPEDFEDLDLIKEEYL